MLLLEILIQYIRHLMNLSTRHLTMIAVEPGVNASVVEKPKCHTRSDLHCKKNIEIYCKKDLLSQHFFFCQISLK